MDPYSYADSGVLINHFGLHDAERLAQIETDLAVATMAGLMVRVLPGNYDLAHLRDFHRQLFGQVYPWAGEIRTIAIAKTDLFCLPQHIEAYSAEVFASLSKEANLRGLSRELFVARLAHYFSEVNAIHPFREGNGRTQRTFSGSWRAKRAGGCPGPSLMRTKMWQPAWRPCAAITGC